MHIKLPRTYKLLLALVVVIGPFYWLVFTDDGQRRTDLVMLHLMGRPSFDIAYERLTNAATEQLFRDQFPDLKLECVDRPSPFGSRVCAAPIASFNALPARSAVLYFNDDRLRALRLDYRVRYHDLLVNSLRERFGDPREETTGDVPVLTWQLDGGLVMLPAVAVEHEADAALLWLAPEVVAP